jgi:hypothetical protein
MVLASLSVMAFCTIGIAGMAGLLPIADSPVSPLALWHSDFAPTTDARAPVKITAPRSRLVAPKPGKPIEFQHGRPVTSNLKACDACGVIESVSRQEGHTPAFQTVWEEELTNPLAIPLIGMAHATARTEQAPDGKANYVVIVRMDDGTYKTLRDNQKPALSIGVRVSINDGILSPIR